VRAARPRSPQPEDHELTAAERPALLLLTIDLGAVARNYRTLRDLSAPAECAAVVKADAYGLGMAEVAPVLAQAGCKTFFVATLDEAMQLRALLPEAVIYVFSGLVDGSAEAYRDHDLRPVLNSIEEIEEWSAFCKASRQRLPAAIHIDSGMNRLGLSAAEVDLLASASDRFDSFELALVMSHLACADDPDHPKSELQRHSFDIARIKLPHSPASIANSAGIFLGPDFHYDLVRPGIALYGGKARRRGENQVAPVVKLSARILQVRVVPAGETVGYGATWTAKRRSRIAVLSIGYADGLFRSLSVADGKSGLSVHVGSHPAPILGRVSMDLVTIDVTDVPADAARRGALVEILGDQTHAHVLAAHAGTIDYEVLTALGARAMRRYVGG
jgi:alanine racemase